MSRSVALAHCHRLSRSLSELNDAARGAQGHYESGYVVTIGLMYFCVGAILASLCALLLADVRGARASTPNRCPHDPTTAAVRRDRCWRRAPSRPRQRTRCICEGGARWNQGRGTLLPAGGRAPARAPARPRLLVLCFVVLFPLVIFCVLTLPDEFTEFTHWAVRHYEHAEYNASKRTRVEHARIEALNLKLYPDLVWFYGVM